MPTPEVFSDRYELVRHIARGGMAQVYLAQDLLLDRPVAIKVLFPELSSDPSFVERFRREAQAAANLSHANIVSIYDWGQGEHTYFIVMEYIDGQTLSALIRQGPLAPGRAAAIGADMASALDFAHRRGVIHRDVKPGNVLIDHSGQVKVADFGIARAVSQASEGLTQTGAVMGTATYFSPEQAQGLPVDARSDVYSLGVVLYEMVTGKPPFSGDSPVAIAYKHVREYPSLPSAVNAAVPAEFEAIVMAAMAKDAEDRYQSAADLRDDLLRFQRGEPVYAPRPGAAAAPTRVVVPSRTGSVQRSSTSPYGETAVDGHTSVMEAISTYDAEDAPKSHAGWWAALFAFLLAVLGVLVFFIGNNAGWWGHKTASTVPSLKGYQVPAAEARLEADGLRWTVSHSPSLLVPPGQVSGTTPGAGSRVPGDHRVTLVVSSGPPYSAVPHVAGMHCAQADLALADKHFHAHNVARTSDTIGPNIVISTSPAGGTKVRQLSTVEVYCSKGQNQTNVPELSGLTAVEAGYKLAAAHLQPKPAVDKVWSTTVKPGLIVYSQPPAGAPVAWNTQVQLFVSGGPKMTSVPSDLVGESVAQAKKELKNAQLGASVVNVQVSNPNQNGRVIRTSPAPGQSDRQGAAVQLFVGEYTGPAATTTAPGASTTSPAASTTSPAATTTTTTKKSTTTTTPPTTTATTTTTSRTTTTVSTTTTTAPAASTTAGGAGAGGGTPAT